eukprot:CAMPEP_0198249802 /NCGR_PEP_ID=MMETSP1447-20131203/1196_1 /TAXON_ID=420782 /ORGANISM="Chaetoceros dichaeta, Strain CCMP1751" /LENGTH=555 /DNA_ID=CAMNT_0043934511 /DNA_START=88 /DNA_END=1752 /DNA_ORIENTATION=+
MFFQKAVTLLYLAYGVQGERAFNFDTVCVISETHNGDFNGDLGSATLCKDHSVTGIDDCYVKLKYLYTITNISTDSAIRVQGITVPDNGENQEVTLDQTPIIKDAQVFAHHEVTKDFCDLSGLEISHLAVAVASYLEHDYGQDDLSRAGKVAPYMTSTTAFTVSDLPLPTAPLTWEMSPWDTSGTIVKCNIDDTSSVQTCEDYVKMIEADDVSPNTRDQCIQDVTFQYKYILTGDSCYTITSLQSELDGRAFVIGYDKYHSLDGFSCDDRKFCKGDEVMVDDKRTVDFCANAGRTVHFIGTINDVKAEEDNMRQKAPWTFPPISLDAPDTPPPASAPVPLTTTPSKTPTKAPAVADCKQCQGHPKEMYFQYLGSGNTCEKSENGLTTNCKEPSNPVPGRGKGAGKGASSTGGIGSTGGNKKPKKGKKGSKEFACDDLFTIADDPPKISVSDLKGRIYFRSSDDNPINKNGCFTASPANAITGKAIKAGSNGNKKMKSGPKMPSTTVVRIKNQDKGGLDENGMLKDQLAQTFTFHTSCSTPFFTGDTYGALKLIGW